MLKRKKMLACFAVVLSLLMVISSCGGDKAAETTSGGSTTAAAAGNTTAAADDTTTAGAEGESNFNELGTFPIVKEKENITVYHAPGNAEFNGDTNWMSNYYEEKTNVSVTWNIATQDQFKEKVNLAFASAEQIDFVIAGGSVNTGYSMTEVLKFSEQGVILPIDDLIENDSIYFKQRLEADQSWHDLITLPNGGIYAVPRMNECYHCMYYGKMWINQEFLKNVGLENPTTVEEFHEMLLAFKEQDANGNGDPNDEIPMMGAIDSFGAKIDTYLMSAFIYDDGENRLFLDDDKNVVAAFAQPEFQEGLKYINTLFNDDLIHKESFTQTREVRGKMNSQVFESIGGAIPDIHHGGSGTREVNEPLRWSEYEAIPPLVGPNGLQTTRYDHYIKYQMGRTGGLIPATCKDPSLVFRWLDWFMSDEGTTMVLQGEEGLGWNKPDEGATGVDGGPALYNPVYLQPSDEFYNNMVWGQDFPNFNSAAYRLAQQMPDDMFAVDGSGLEKYLYKLSSENYAPYAFPVENLLPPLYYSTDNVSEIAQLTTDINTYVEESIAKFVIGDMDIESDWDRYLTELNNLGLPKYLEIIQSTYDNSAFAK